MTIKDHVINAMAAAVTIGIGSVTLGNNVELGRQDERIKRIEALSDDMKTLQGSLGTTQRQLDRLDQKLTDQAGHNER